MCTSIEPWTFLSIETKMLGLSSARLEELRDSLQWDSGVAASLSTHEGLSSASELHRFRKQYEDVCKDLLFADRIEKLGASVRTSSMFASLTAAGELADGLFDSPAWDNLRKTGFALTETMRVVAETITPRSLGIQTWLTRNSQVSMTASAVVAAMGGVPLGTRVGLESELSASLQESFNSFTNSYAAYSASLGRTLNQHPGIDMREAGHGAALDLFTVSEVAELVTIQQSDEIEEIKTPVREGLLAEADETIIEWLSRLDPAYVKRLGGARQALHSENPEYRRHFAVSQRELLRDIIAGLAPDTDVMNWMRRNHLSERDGYLHQGRVTRKARVHYCMRDLDPSLRGVFQDASKVVSFLFDVLNKAVHEDDFNCRRGHLKSVELIGCGLLYLLAKRDDREL